MLISNYLTSAWRNILKHKLFSFINILGLAIGLSAVLLISLFVRDELSYDNFWKNADNIYRPQLRADVPGMDKAEFVAMPAVMREAFLRDFPQVEYATLIHSRDPIIKYKDKYFHGFVRLVNKDISHIFDFKTLRGDVEQALSTNSGLVITKSKAQKFFGNEDPIGKILTLDFDEFVRDYKVAAIIDDLPKNSMLNIDIMVLLDPNDWTKMPLFTAWLWLGNQFYFTLPDGVDVEEINLKFPDFINKNFIAFQDQNVKKLSDIISIKALNIKDLHLDAVGMGEYQPRGSRDAVIIFSVVSVLTLIIAAVNFMNLSTARAGLRAKEVSMRKVLGASRKNLIIQFLGESWLIALMALILALLFVELSLPAYNEILNKSLSINYASSDLLQISLLTLFIGTGAGIYPAFFLSGFRPASILKANKSIETKNSAKLRTVLVIGQFAVSISLFVSTAVVYGQMQYATNMDFGFNEQNLITIPTGGRKEVREKAQAFIDQLRLLPNIINATYSSFSPAEEGESINSYRTAEMAVGDEQIINIRTVGYHYFDTYGVKLLAGREYDIDKADLMPSTDEIRAGKEPTGAIIINSSGLRRFNLGTPEEAVGKILYKNIGDKDENLQATYEIIGVVPDIYFNSLKLEIRPEVYSLDPRFVNIISVRYSGDPKNAVDKIRALWQQQFPTVEFSYDLVTDKLLDQYKQEQGQMTMFAAFSILAIFIACLGLFGLASFTAERRTKEIGIRKVFGAEVWQIVKLLVWQFSIPVLIANIIAWPIAYLAMSRWLESFVYRIDDMVIIALCLLAGLTALLIAWATVAGNSMSTARTNPVNALRYE